MKRLFAGVAAALICAPIASSAWADGVLNVYSSRHYDTDERLYADFEAQTGITINRVEAKADELIARMRAEGRRSPADVLITVDAGRLWRAEQARLFQPVESEALNAAIPAHMRHPDGLWYGFSTRARMIFFAKDRVAEPPQTYADLADPKYRGLVCARSSSNIYMLSLMASLIAHDGAGAAQDWAKGVVANFARRPQGGDTDQLRGIVSGECDIALANSYYFARAIRKDVRGLSDAIDQIGWVFPNQDGRGAHVNISGAGVAAHAPNRANAVLFLEYLASPEAQAYFSAGNDEFPVVEGTEISPSAAHLGAFQIDDLNLEALGRNQALAQMLYDVAGYR